MLIKLFEYVVLYISKKKIFLSLQVKIKSKIYLNNLLDYASVFFNCDWLKKSYDYHMILNNNNLKHLSYLILLFDFQF